jgi:HPt (histidine-containing phosphotransfer) domain-containing protein
MSVSRTFGSLPRGVARPAPERAGRIRRESGPAIDLVHLARQSLGDRALEMELLGLFERQAGQILAQLTNASATSDRRFRHDLAHTLKGSARAVGANRVAAAAQAYEEALYSGLSESDVTGVRDELALAVEEARKAALGLGGEW